jgi:hypothetical protein
MPCRPSRCEALGAQLGRCLPGQGRDPAAHPGQGLLERLCLQGGPLVLLRCLAARAMFGHTGTGSPAVLADVFVTRAPDPAFEVDRRVLAVLGGLMLCLAAMAAMTPAASAIPAPPEPDDAPLPPPPAVTPAGLPPWAILAMLASTVVLSVAATLITLSLERALRARNARRAVRSPPDVPSSTPRTAPDQGAAWSVSEILDSDPALRDRTGRMRHRIINH